MFHVAAVAAQIGSAGKLSDLFDNELLFKVAVTQSFGYFFRVGFYPFQQIVAGEELVVVGKFGVGFDQVPGAGIVVKLIDFVVVLQLVDRQQLVVVQRLSFSRAVAGQLVIYVGAYGFVTVGILAAVSL